MSTSSDYLVIGAAPRPHSSEALTALLRSTLATFGDTVQVAGMTAAAVDAELDGSDIARLSLDLTGVSVTVAADSTTGTATALGTPAHTERAVLREFSLRANPLTITNPLTINGVEFVLDSSASDLPFVWADDAAGRLALGGDPDASVHPRVTAHAEADTDALVAALTALATDQLAEANVSVSDVEVDLESISPREARLSVTAKLKRGILGASASFSAHVLIDDGMVLHLSDAEISSRNPLVAALLLTVRQRVEDAVSRPIDLNEWMPAPLRLSDVRMSLGRRILVDLVFG